MKPGQALTGILLLPGTNSPDLGACNSHWAGMGTDGFLIGFIPPGVHHPVLMTWICG